MKQQNIAIFNLMDIIFRNPIKSSVGFLSGIQTWSILTTFCICFVKVNIPKVYR
jgi:hypothetical protein